MDDWTILAFHYGTADRPPSDLALDVDDAHEGPGRIEYFVWLVRRGDRLILVDTGFHADEGRARGRTLLVHPVDALGMVGVAPGDITDVVITHLHYDHAGNLPAFPNATFHVQDREMAYGTGRCMCHARMRHPFAAEAVVDAVRLVFRSRMHFHDGDATIAPGVSLHLVGGHSRGLQVVRVEAGGEVRVLASDALHFAHYLATGNAFPVFADYADVMDGYGRLKALAGPGGRIVPGHDPAVLADYPPVTVDRPRILKLL